MYVSDAEAGTKPDFSLGKCVTFMGLLKGFKYIWTWNWYPLKTSFSCVSTRQQMIDIGRKYFIPKKVKFLWSWRRGRTELTFSSCRAMHQGGWREVKWRAWRCRTTAFLLKPGESWWALHFSFRVTTQTHVPSHRSSNVISSWSLWNMAVASITAHTAVNISLTTCLWTKITVLNWIQLQILNLERTNVEISGFYKG